MTAEQHPDELATYCKAIARRAGKVAQLATDPRFADHPEARRLLIERYGTGLMIALTQLCGGKLRDSWLSWVAEQGRKYHGCCPWCGRVMAAPDDPMCQTCVAECEKMDEELGLAEFAALPAKSDLEGPTK